MKNRTIKTITKLLAAGIMLTGCGNNTNVGNTQPATGTVTVYDVDEAAPDKLPPEAYGDLDISALKLFNESLQAAPNENVLISPFSVDVAFGMLENGASDTTLMEIEKVFGDLQVSDMNIAMNSLINRMKNDTNVSWNIANSIWLNKTGAVDGEGNSLDGGFTLYDEFCDILNHNYSAEYYITPFDENAAHLMNSWVNTNTNGMIDKIVDGTPQGVAHIMNALAFEGKWETEFTNVRASDFTNFDGTTSEVEMLYGSADSYFEIGDGQGFTVPYQGGDYSFVGILPPEEMSLAEFSDSLVKENISIGDCINNAKSEEVSVNFPEFKTEYSTDLVQKLHNLGMTEAFSPDADFSRLSDAELYVDSVIHKTYIEVTREGTKAAAVTDITTKNAAGPSLRISLDRPYMYAIIDNASGLPIFIGAQNMN